MCTSTSKKEVFALVLPSFIVSTFISFIMTIGVRLFLSTIWESNDFFRSTRVEVLIYYLCIFITGILFFLTIYMLKEIVKK